VLCVGGDCRAAAKSFPSRRPSTVIAASFNCRWKSPSPCSRASTAPRAIVAWPQNGTSAAGAKKRTRQSEAVPATGAANAVSENPTSAAMRCISATEGCSGATTTPAGLPPVSPSEKAASLSTFMIGSLAARRF
jgi:hypothetical protein